MSPVFRRGPDTRPRKERTGANPFVVGLIVLIVAAVGTYFGFAKHVPFTHGYRLKAVFTSANSIRKNSPVRIAGVNVGKISGVSGLKGTNDAVVTMDLSSKALPIHKDATLKIRPRIFLEGNFYVELSPGTPSAPTLSSGDTVPVTQTAVPVQLDQVLTALQTDTRQELKDALAGYGQALTYKPTPADDVGQDPDVKGLTGAQALNKAAKYAPGAFRDTAIVNQAFLGTEPHDLSGVVANVGRVAKALDTNEAQLEDLVVNFNHTMATFAGEAVNLRTTIRLLPGVLRNANNALDSLNRAFPPTRAFAKEILPGVRETPATINAAFPWIAQARQLLSEPELRGLAADLSPTTRDLAHLTDATIQLLPQADLLSKCASDVILPTGDIKISDGSLTTNKENYKEFWYTMVGLAGESQNFDGNGPYVRFQPGGGDQTVSTGKEGGSLGDTLFANAASKPLGTRPAYPGKRPPYRPDVPCYTNPLPDLNGAPSGQPDGGGSAGTQSPSSTGTPTPLPNPVPNPLGGRAGR